ncbi:AAA family ATPase [Haloimpatiens sp. FM7330]|uniref:AAA family ATPase n=1 Tax=Haloimpatiens sp. FM7330 TaxID=3298610 RepID=UPI0036401E42
MKKIPYGISNFERVIKENYIYIDKTKYIEMLEEYPPYQFFVRPIKFGKSLFISMLENYYDINKEDKFEEIFERQYIGENHTNNKNKYLILKLNFSGISVRTSKEQFIQQFNYEVKHKVSAFINKYKSILRISGMPQHIKNSVEAIKYISTLASQVHKKIFLLIDDYDSFTNDLIIFDTKLYRELLRNGGVVRCFYEVLKDSAGESIDRIFVTGTAPIMLDELNSSMNILANLTLEEKLNDMMGFNEEEMKEIVYELELGEEVDENNILEDMNLYYNGYKFSKECENEIYNPNIILYFLQKIKINNKYPDIIDNNLKMDYSKVKEIAINFKDKTLMKNIMTDKGICEEVKERFNIDNIYKEKKNFISLLFYLGMLTIKSNSEDEVKLGIPNEVIKSIYWDYLYEGIKQKVNTPKSQLKNDLFQGDINDEISNFNKYLKGIMNNFSSKDLKNI